MSEWTNPRHAGTLVAYRAAQQEHGYPREFGRWRKRQRWCDGFAMVTDPATGAVFTTPHGLPRKDPEQT
ncbi:hypothetical protein [Streptantibioticus ferralitis]|uniref:Transposase n=1 Tax=Streptantibioticus ferralitis TaxID=236510 RepID=A0ABT5Z8H2_9ACTN|nr:hypothetical protein [Streptantibioticus ferralitis]MDF2259937.1 hypothetical protein [Streptantibioticus ferralitis]